jgi:flagellar hook-length control protein FliK
MPAPISFALPNVMTANSAAPADGAVMSADGVGAFAQLIDAAAQMQAGVAASAETAMPQGEAMPAAPLLTDSEQAFQAEILPQKDTPHASPAEAEYPLPDAPDAESAAQPAMPQPSETPAAAALPVEVSPAVAAAPQLASALADPAGDPPDIAEDQPLSLDEESDAAMLTAAAPDLPRAPLPAAPLALPGQGQAADQAAMDAAFAADQESLAPLPAARPSAAAETRLNPAMPQGEAATSDEGGDTPQPQTQTQTQAAAPTPASAQRADSVEPALPAALFTQSLASISNAAPTNPYAATMAAADTSPVVQARSGQMGADIGAEIAKVLKGEGDGVVIRLDPRELGRIDVRLNFDRDGILRAVLSVDSPAALEMLRRDSGDLTRSLQDAGVRSDGQSLRFDARSGDGAGQGAQQWRDARSGNGGSGADTDNFNDDNVANYRPLRTTNQVDLIA